MKGLPLSSLPLSPVTLEAVQGAAIRATVQRLVAGDIDTRWLVVQLAEVAKNTDPLVDAAVDPLVGVLLDLAALALLWVEQIEGQS